MDDNLKCFNLTHIFHARFRMDIRYWDFISAGRNRHKKENIFSGIILIKSGEHPILNQTEIMMNTDAAGMELG